MKLSYDLNYSPQQLDLIIELFIYEDIYDVFCGYDGINFIKEMRKEGIAKPYNQMTKNQLIGEFNSRFDIFGNAKDILATYKYTISEYERLFALLDTHCPTWLTKEYID